MFFLPFVIFTSYFSIYLSYIHFWLQFLVLCASQCLLLLPSQLLLSLKVMIFIGGTSDSQQRKCISNSGFTFTICLWSIVWRQLWIQLSWIIVHFWPAVISCGNFVLLILEQLWLTYHQLKQTKSSLPPPYSWSLPKSQLKQSLNVKTWEVGQPQDATIHILFYIFHFTGGSRLMQISLLQISLLRFFKKIHKSALCVVLMRIFGYFISLVRFFGLYFADASFG